MTSTIVPPVDLAPGMPSRVVTISATDVTEGGKSLEGQMVRFALSDTLDVTSGGDVIAKTQAEVVLDANGEGRIRLPVYDEDVKTWCGQDWAILVTATWGSQKAIRVPAGSSAIALSALPPVRPLRGRELQWAITGAGVTVVEGSQWGASVDLSGGVLRFVITVPPGGTAWDKTWTPLTAEADLSTLTPGIYRTGGGSVATALGLPVIEVSAVTVVGMSAVAANHSALVEQWAYDGNGGVVQWQAWRNSAGVLGPWSVVPRSRLLESGESSARLGAGSFGVLASRGVEHAPPGTTGALTETTTGNSAWTQQWQSWTMGAADLLVRSQAPDAPGAQYPHGVQPWQRPESPRAVEWVRQELAALQASLTPPKTDGTMPSSAWSVPAATVPMVVPTPDGTGQATHPSVVDVPGGWNGHRYWMAYTPYAYADNAVEDPCLAWSDNGISWTKVATAFPLDDAPGSTIYNSDTHLTLVDGTMYATWRKVESNVSTTFYMRTSTTGFTWTPTETVWSAGLTPAFSQVLEKSATGWRLWFVGGGSGSRNLSWIDTTAARPTSGWGAIQSTTLPTPVGREPWHVDIRRLGNRWWGVLTDTDIGMNGVNCQIRLMQSADGITWDVAATQLVPHLGHSHDVLYKAALTVTGATTVPTVRLWYSGLSADAGWWLYRGGIPTVHDPHAAPVDDTDWTAMIAALNAAAA